MNERKNRTGRWFAWAAGLAALGGLGPLLADADYRDMGMGLLLAALAALAAAFGILLVFGRRTVLSGIVKFWAILLVNTVIFGAAGVYWFGPVAIFHPHGDEAAEAALAEEASVEYAATEDGVLSGWLYRCGAADAPVILCFYGNGETASRKTLELTGLARRGYFPGFDFAVFDYPGYGRAPGRPTERSLLRMALAAFDRLRERYDTVCVLGYSIGTGPANYVAAERPVAALALMAPYADGYDLYNSALDIFHGPLTRLLVSFKMESRLWARRVTVTPLLLASPRDRTVPFASSRALAECYPRAEFRPVEVADHAAFWQNEECLRLLSAYFTEAVS